LNYFGVFLLFSSSLIIFTPFMEQFPGVAPNGWEILIWLAWGYAVFAYSIFFLFVTNLFKFIEEKKEDSNTSPPVRYWVKNLKIMGLSFLIWIASIIIFWNSGL